MDDFSEFVPNVHFEKIPIKNLVSNQDYQRNLSQARIEKTAENKNTGYHPKMKSCIDCWL